MALSKKRNDDDDDDDVQKNLRELTSAKSIKEDAALLVKSYIDVGQLLVPAPASICVLGQLMLSATQADFDLSMKPPREGFQFLRHPESFRACLIQIANDGYIAHSNAHTSMETIQLETGQILGVLKNILTVLFKGTLDEAKIVLPIELKSLKDSAENCFSNAKETEKNFKRAMFSVEELIEAIISTQGQYEEDMRNTDKQIKMADKQKEKLKQEEEYIETRKNELEESVDEAIKLYVEACKEMPTMSDLQKMEERERMWDTIKIGLGCLAFGFGLAAGTRLLLTQNPKKVIATGLAKAGAAAQTANVTPTGLLKLTTLLDKFNYLHTGGATVLDLLKLTTHLHKFDNSQPGKAAYPCKEKNQSKTGIIPDLTFVMATTSIQDKADYLHTTFVNNDDITLNINEMNKETKKRFKQCVKDLKVAHDIVKKSQINIGVNISEVIESMKVDGKSGRNLAERITENYEKTVSTTTELSVLLGTERINVSPPLLSSGDKKAKELISENAQLKVRQTAEMLKSERERYDRVCEHLEQIRKDLRLLVTETEGLDIKKVDFKNMIARLRKINKWLSEIREQWSKMALGFQKTSTFIDVCLNKSVKKLTDVIETSLQGNFVGSSIDGFFKDMIYQLVFQASETSHILNIISTDFVDVSERHIMTKIAGLSKLLSYDPETEKQEIEEAFSALTHEFEEAQEEIAELMKKKKEDYDRKRRIEDLSRALPPPSPANDRIQAAVKEGISRGLAAQQEMETSAEASFMAAEADFDIDDLL